VTYPEIGFLSCGLEAMRTRVSEGQLNALRALLPDDAIWKACNIEGYKYRRRLLTPLVVILHYLSAALWPEDSFQITGDRYHYCRPLVCPFRITGRITGDRYH